MLVPASADYSKPLCISVVVVHCELVKGYMTQLDKLNARLEKLLSEMSAAGEQSLHRAPVEGAWTPLQTLHHIYLVEQRSLDYLLYKYGQEEPAPSLTLRHRLNGAAVSVALLSPIKFRSPDIVDSRNVAAERTLSLDSLNYQLRLCRTDLKDLLKNAPPEWIKGAVFRHPQAGRMSMSATLRFLGIHQNRHSKQIRRALSQNARNNRR